MVVALWLFKTGFFFAVTSSYPHTAAKAMCLLSNPLRNHHHKCISTTGGGDKKECSGFFCLLHAGVETSAMKDIHTKKMEAMGLVY